MQKFFSICIPQYNRWPYLLENLKVLSKQTFRNFEICISDDNSTEQGKKEILDFLAKSEIFYRFYQQNKNVGYDKNLRSTINLASGKYVFLLGNDDCLAEDYTLEKLHILLQENNCDILTTKKVLWGEKYIQEPIKNYRLGSGKDAATDTFHRVTFISGLIINREKAQLFSSEEWDGTANYHVFLVPRIVSHGGTFVDSNFVSIKYDININGIDARQKITEYIKKDTSWPGIVRFGCQMTETIFSKEEIYSGKYTPPISGIFLHLYLFAFPAHLHQFRQALGIAYAFKIWREFAPALVISYIPITRKHNILIHVAYAFSLLFVIADKSLWKFANSGKKILRKIFDYKT